MIILTNRRFFYTKIPFWSVLLLFFANSALQSQDFEVAPVLVSFDANPGEIQTKTLTIRNHNNSNTKFLMSLSDYRVNIDGSKERLPAGSTDRTMNNWLTINPSLIDLNPNESGEVELILTVPNGGFATRWGMIHVEVAKEQNSSSADKNMEAGVLVVPRIVVLMKQSPRSSSNYKGAVTDLREVTRSGDEFRTFEATIKNQGDNILDAKLFLAVANLETMEENQYAPKRMSIYPEQELKTTLTLTEKLDPGSYAIAFLMDFGHRSAIEGAQMLLEVQ